MTPNQITGLQAFARYMINAALEDCNVDGGTIQEIAHQYGLLTKREMKGPCREPEEGYCACALVSGFPVECYQPTDALIAKSAPAEPISREAVGWLCTHSDGRKRIELPGSVYDQDAGWGASRVPLYTATPSPDAELVELLRSKFPRIDQCQPVPLDEKAHCCEYTIYVERERLHRLIDAKLASGIGSN